MERKKAVTYISLRQEVRKGRATSFLLLSFHSRTQFTG
jgi:hypothetical protein